MSEDNKRVVRGALSNLTADDIETIQGMVEFCIEKGYCLGMDEGVRYDLSPKSQTKRLSAFCEIEDAGTIKQALTALDNLYDKAALIKTLEGMKMEWDADMYSKSWATRNEIDAHNAAIDAAIKAVGGA